MRITNYIVIVESDTIELTKEVKRFIQEGWQPSGSMSIGIRNVAQTMVRYEKETKTAS